MKREKKEKRFERVYLQGGLDAVEILLDKETGVQYLYRQSGYSGGLTVLVDKEGKPLLGEVEIDGNEE